MLCACMCHLLPFLAPGLWGALDLVCLVCFNDVPLFNESPSAPFNDIWADGHVGVQTQCCRPLTRPSEIQGGWRQSHGPGVGDVERVETGCMGQEAVSQALRLQKRTGVGSVLQGSPVLEPALWVLRLEDETSRRRAPATHALTERRDCQGIAVREGLSADRTSTQFQHPEARLSALFCLRRK